MIASSHQKQQLLRLILYKENTLERDRIKLHCYYDAAIYEGIKECGGYTVVLLLVTTEEKSVGILFFSILMKEEKSVGYTVFLRV